MINWYQQPYQHRAPRGGVERFGRTYKGGEFLPFYVPRPVMPQINEEDYYDFIAFANEKGAEIKVNYIDPKQAKPHQRIDRIHAAKMPPEVRRKTIFVSRDWYILDGNHRWKLHALERSKIAVYQIDLPFEEAIGLMFAFPKTYALAYAQENN